MTERVEAGRGYAYRATYSESELTSQRIRDMLDQANDRASALAGFVDSLDTGDIQHLRRILAKLDGQIIGRVNLTGVTRPYFNKAALGYRIGERFGGRGYATRVVALLLDEAFGALDLWRLEATARPQNLGSVAVMQRNGFHQYGKSEQAMFFQNAWSDLLYFERRNTQAMA